MPAKKAKPTIPFDASGFPGDAFNRAGVSLRLGIIQKGAKTPSDARALRELVQSIEIQEDDRMATMATITFDNPEFFLSRRDSLLAPGTILIPEIGYGKNLAGGERAVEVIRILPALPREGKPTFTVKGYDARQRMLEPNVLSDRGIDKNDKSALYGKLPGTWKRQTLQIVLDRVALTFGFALELDPVFSLPPYATERKTFVKKKDQTWWDFILKLADKYDADVWVDYSKQFTQWELHFKKRNRFGDPGLDLEYGKKDGVLLDFRPKLDSVGQQNSVQVLHYDRRKRRSQIQFTLDRRDREGGVTFRGTNEFFGALVKIQVGGKVTHIFNTGRPFKSKKDAQRFAENYVLRNREDFITAEGTTIGLSRLRPRQIHRIKGGLPGFDGNYYFTQVTHKIPQGGPYECSFVAYKVPTRFVVPKAAQRNARIVFTKQTGGGEDIAGSPTPPDKNKFGGQLQ